MYVRSVSPVSHIFLENTISSWLCIVVVGISIYPKELIDEIGVEKRISWAVNVMYDRWLFTLIFS